MIHTCIFIISDINIMNAGWFRKNSDEPFFSDVSVYSELESRQGLVNLLLLW